MWFGIFCFIGWFAVAWITLGSLDREFETRYGRKMRGRESSCAILASMLWFLAIPCLIGMMIDKNEEENAKK